MISILKSQTIGLIEKKIYFRGLVSILFDDGFSFTDEAGQIIEIIVNSFALICVGYIELFCVVILGNSDYILFQMSV